MSNITKIYGPPGTGKTTKLLGIIEQAIADGVSPDAIGYYGFTKESANVAIERACAKFNLSPKQLPHFRTLHSLGYKQLGLNSDDVFSRNHLKDFANLMGLDMTFKFSFDDDSFSNNTDDDKMFFYANLATVKQVPLEDIHRDSPDSFSFLDLERIHRGLAEYKKAHGLYDFNDMLSEVLAQSTPLPVLEVLVIDEAQDLSALQWKIVDRLVENANKTYIAGDDDQAIFEWAGADVQKFLAYPGEDEVLSHSYRLPQYIHKYADRISRTIHNRKRKEWQPREGTGKLNFESYVESVKVDESKGSWLFLTRHKYQQYKVADLLKQEGLYFKIGNYKSIDPATVEAVKTWETLRAGKTVAVKMFQKLIKYLPKGFDKLAKLETKNGVVDMNILDKHEIVMSHIHREWFKVMLIDQRDIAYMRTLLQRGTKLSEEPKIRVSTMHGAKGSEADNVVVLTDVSKKTYEMMQYNPDSEVRVFYTAITRAKESLTIIEPSTRYYYEY